MCLLQILIITRTNGDMSHFARVGIFNSGLRMTNVGPARAFLVILSPGGVGTTPVIPLSDLQSTSNLVHQYVWVKNTHTEKLLSYF